MRPTKFSVSALLAIFLTSASSHGAVVASVDWDNSDNIADGVITGTLGGTIVTLTTNIDNFGDPGIGGVFLGTGTNWASNLGSDNVPGISDPGIINEAAVVAMGEFSEGRTEISFSEPVTNPTVLINFVHDNFIYFQFDQNMPLLQLVDSATLPDGGIVPTAIGDGGISNLLIFNRVEINNGEGNDTADSGFAVRLTGTFSEIGFDTNAAGFGITRTVGLTVLASTTAIPEPSSAFLVATAVAMMGLRRRRG